jgi:hypothetical protein
MHTINVRKVGEQLYEKIKQEAQKNGMSMNSLIVRTLERAFFEEKIEYHDLDSFFGTWNDEDAEAVNSALADSRNIDDEMWK